jgi:hypothetical protein
MRWADYDENDLELPTIPWVVRFSNSEDEENTTVWTTVSSKRRNKRR